MRNHDPRNGQHRASRLGLFVDGIVNGLKVILSLGLAAMLLVGSALVPLVWEEFDPASESTTPAAISEPIYEIELGRDEHSLLVRTRREILVRDLQTGELLAQMPRQSRSVAAATWVAGSHRVLIGLADGRLMLWEPEKDAIREFSHSLHEDSIRAVLTTRGGATAITGSADRIGIWDVQTESLLAQVPITDGRVTQLALTSDETQVLIGCDNGQVKILSLRDFRVVKQHQAEIGRINEMASLDEGRRILIGKLNGTSFVMDADTGQIVRWLPPLHLHLLDLRISPDHRFAACTDWTNDIQVYSLETWEKVATLKGHAKAVSTLRFSEKEPVLYSGGHDGIVRRWDLNTFADLGGFQGSVPIEE